MNIRSAQNLGGENKLAKGFNTADVPLEFCLLNGEVAEAFDACVKVARAWGRNWPISRSSCLGSLR